MSKKNKPIKIRRTWEINPRERIREDKKSLDPCVECGKYKTNPEECFKCQCENRPIEEIENI